MSWLRILTCLNALVGEFWRSNDKVVMDDKINQKIVMDEELFSTA